MISPPSTETNPEPRVEPATDWPSMLANLRARYPRTSDGTLFCVYKLQQDSALRIPDIRDEARLHGIALAGRSLHSARTLLGLAGATDGAPRSAAPPREPRKRARTSATNGPLEDRLVGAITDIQKRATADTARLRRAIEQAVEILQEALEEQE